MYALHKNRLQSRIWKTVRILSIELKASVISKYGETEEFEVKNSIRQGGVLAVTQFALLMDEIAKEIENRNLGVTIPLSLIHI